jgi:hypothetical protein
LSSNKGVVPIQIKRVMNFFNLKFVFARSAATKQSANALYSELWRGNYI